MQSNTIRITQTSNLSNEIIEHTVCVKVSTSKIIAATVEAVLQGVLK
jgi:hypothetical protein